MGPGINLQPHVLLGLYKPNSQLTLTHAAILSLAIIIYILNILNSSSIYLYKKIIIRLLNS